MFASSHQVYCCYAALMRTTLTLDPDIAAQLRRLAAERGASLTSTINATLRTGLEAGLAQGRPYRETTRDLGTHPGVDLDKALRLAADLEDETIARELELRK